MGAKKMDIDQYSKDYNWIILFFLFASAISRLIMQFIKFNYTDHFVAVISLIGLDYTITSILNRVKRTIEKIIENNNDIVAQAKTNKKNKRKRSVYICISILACYNILHFVLLSCSTGNDMLSMIVLGISLTDDSIINFLVEHTHI